ncbi:MAG: calcium-binding protein, partial [Ilumatobacteraceae bacterium]|nr:calcium-binding protein [Ilumatobacteraceae bacterium]
MVTENVDEGTDTVQSSISYMLGANVENLTLTGTGAINGTGNAIDNIITGNNSNNILNGGVGDDTMQGGLGNDTYVVDSIGDVVTEAASAGIDTVQSSLSYTLGENIENLTLTGSEALTATGNTVANLLIGNSLDNTLDGGAGNDTMQGGAGNDLYVVDSTGDVVTEAATAGTDTVQSSVSYTLSLNVENLKLTGSDSINGTGNTLTNLLLGNSGNNTLNGGAGNDTMQGGEGNDTYIVDSVSDVVTENVDEGTDTVQSSVSYTLGDNVEHLTMTGTGAINGTGNTVDNLLIGNTGNNILNGGAGNDTMQGGLGNDTYVVDSVSDVVTEAATAGTDMVQSSLISYTLGENVENLTLMGAEALTGAGNTVANLLIGNIGDNTLDGGAGNDTMQGGAGNDLYVVDSSGDVLTEAASAGTDTVQSSVSYTLALNVENLTLTGSDSINGTGNTLANLLLGNSGNNTLNGGAGNDTMQGGAGSDTYVVDSVSDVVTENEGEGTDTVQTSVSYTLVANVENLTLTGTGAINGTGNTVANLLIGNTGNNILNGIGGNDTMQGGLGNDTYVVDSVSDVVTEAALAGTDTVQSSLSYTLGENVENLTLTGAEALTATGNMVANLLIGNSIDNTLDGGAGNDTMQGGAGNDLYVVDSTGDVVTEAATAGTDTVQSSVSYTLSLNVENLTLTGNDSINGTGNTLANLLLGNSGD